MKKSNYLFLIVLVVQCLFLSGLYPNKLMAQAKTSLSIGVSPLEDVHSTFLNQFFGIKSTKTKKLKAPQKDGNASQPTPGFISGYIAPDNVTTLPSSLKLLPVPDTVPTSAGFKYDEYLATKVFPFVSEARKERAVLDANPEFPSSLEAFNFMLDVKVTWENTPHLYTILQKAITDVVYSVGEAKEHYKRVLPFVYNKGTTCTPNLNNDLSKNGSFPSGHAAVGWTWALILAEAFPDQATDILIRGKDFGISRNICNAHWHSDVVAGRMMAAAVVSRLHSDPIFLADMAMAKKEIGKLKKIKLSND